MEDRRVRRTEDEGVPTNTQTSQSQQRAREAVCFDGQLLKELNESQMISEHLNSDLQPEPVRLQVRAAADAQTGNTTKTSSFPHSSAFIFIL